jgi:hypothetical protein
MAFFTYMIAFHNEENCCGKQKWFFGGVLWLLFPDFQTTMSLVSPETRRKALPRRLYRKKTDDHLGLLLSLRAHLPPHKMAHGQSLADGLLKNLLS